MVFLIITILILLLPLEDFQKEKNIMVLKGWLTLKVYKLWIKIPKVLENITQQSILRSLNNLTR